MTTFYTKKSLLFFATVLTLSNTFATTFVASKAGKWSDATIWEGARPAGNIESSDIVIIKNHVLVTEDVNVNGSLIIDRNSSITSNRSIAIAPNGQLLNNGSLNVKRMMNEGKIQNNGSLETMSELQNNGILSNDQNVIVGTSMVNQGGNVDGNYGSFFANDNFISSKTTTYGEHVKMFYGGGSQDQVSTLKASDFNVEVVTLENNVTLTVQNLSGYTVKNYNILRSFNGTDYTNISNNENANEITILHDNDIQSSVAHYKVIAQTSFGEIEIPVTSVGLGYSRMSMK